ncbi:amidohydrolase family protein [Candidatus Saccharibacteria bacterium]|nr:amidohydrolase family protein [Candidatus Saccharibacteria bacterium]
MDPKHLLLQRIKENGGWVNAHTHIDRSFIINWENWDKTGDPLHMKWDHPDEFKAKVTVEKIVEHMSQVVENQLAQGVQAIGSFIDCDSIVEDKNLKAADIVKAKYKGQMEIKFIHQPIKGLMDETERKWFEEAASFVDIIGGLPERDSKVKLGVDRKAEHLDILFSTAKKHGKPLHVHVDQYNDPEQRDTELLADKTKEYGYKGKVSAVHSISLAAQPKDYRTKVYKKLVEQDITIIACPSAWIDSKRSEVLAPSHNSVTAIDEMIPAGVRVALGTDDIADIYKPYSDGDLWTELRILLEATHTYDMDILSDIATVNGRKALFLD